MIPYLIPLILVAAIIYNSIKILMEYERGVIFFLGKFQTVKGPGLIIVIPLVQKMLRVNLQTVTMEVPAQDVITRDNVSVKVTAVIFFRVVDPQRAILAVQDYLYSTSQIAQTTLRSVLGQSQLDELLSKREQINIELQRIIDQQTEPWGVKVSAVEGKNVGLQQALTYRGVARKALDWVRESRYTSTQIVIGAFLAMILVGTLLLMLPYATTGPGIRFVDALFTMTSAICVTGLIVLDTPKDFTLFGQLVILLGMQIGEIGRASCRERV